MRAFTIGTIKLYTVTNILGLGLDIAKVRVIIYIDICF